MRLGCTTTKALATLVVFAFLVTACGSGTPPREVPAADAPDVQLPAPGAGSSTSEAGDQPVAAAGDAQDAQDGQQGQEGEEGQDGQSSGGEWEVSVLHVNDGVQIVPVFDEPNGNNIILYDKNDIDGIELEYPLLATTHFGNRLALLVDEYDPTGAWAKVQVPVRPNGTTAWVQTAFFTEEKHDYHITIDLSENIVRVFKGDDEVPIVEQASVVGKDTRPTPVVKAYIDEMIPGAELSPAYGDWVLSIAAFSETLGTFGGGGMPKLALHGTNEPELMGQYASSGGIRVPNEIVSFIAETVPVGTTVDIVP